MAKPHRTPSVCLDFHRLFCGDQTPQTHDLCSFPTSGAVLPQPGFPCEKSGPAPCRSVSPLAPVQNLHLDVVIADVQKRTADSISGRRQHFRKHPHHCAGSGDPTPEPRVAIAYLVREYVLDVPACTPPRRTGDQAGLIPGQGSFNVGGPSSQPRELRNLSASMSVWVNQASCAVSRLKKPWPAPP